MRKLLVLAALLLSFSPAAADVVSRIKDVTSVQGMRDNQIVGYGLVVGLQGTGDSMRNSAFTEQAVQAMLERMGINTRNNQLRTKNVAAVLVTADLPPFIRRGARLDVTVSSLGDATSLMGGTLVLTPLSAVDGTVYAVAQGQLAVTGFTAQGKSEVVTQGVPTAARIPNGAIVEREVKLSMNELRPLVLELRNPDFTTASRIADTINRFSVRRYKKALAVEHDLRSVGVAVPAGVSSARLVSEIGDLLVRTDVPARVVVDARSGTIVIGRDVRLSASAVTHGTLTVRVTETPQVSQPEAFSRGETVVTSDTNISATETGGQFVIMQGPTLRALVRGLNQTGVKPNGIIAILQALKSAGALQAELILQ
ncbi:MAG: flagellar basal body P-ring protein FlgI [Beijerinckiaceae bacterium]